MTYLDQFPQIFLAKRSIINIVVIFCHNNGCVIQSLPALSAVLNKDFSKNG